MLRGAFEWLLRRPMVLATIVAVAVGVPMLALGERSAEQTRELLRQQEVESARVTAVAAADATSAWLSSIRADVASIAEVAELKAAVASGDKDAIREVVQEALRYVGLRQGPGPAGPIQWVFVTDRSGRVLYEAANARLTTDRDLSSADLMARIVSAAALATASAEIDSSDVEVGPAQVIPVGRDAGPQAAGSATPQPTVGVLAGVRIRYALEPFVGAVIVQPNVGQLDSVLGGQLGQLQHIYVVDQNSRVVAHASIFSSRLVLGSELGRSETTQFARAAGPQPHAGVVAGRVVGAAPVGDTDWLVITERSAGTLAEVIEPELARQQILRSGVVGVLVLGALALGGTARRSLRRRDQLAESLGQQTAVAEMLKTISRSAFDLQVVLDTVVRHAVRLSRADVAWLSKGDEFFARYESAGAATSASLGAGDPGGRGRHPGNVLGERAMAQRTTIQLARLADDPEIAALSQKSSEAWSAVGEHPITRARTLLAVPLLRQSAAVGVLVAGRFKEEAFTRQEIRLVETFADQAAIAIENVRLFNEIQQKSRQLEVVSRHKSDFLANMSHELRTPLNAIIGFSEVLRSEMAGPLSEHQREYLDDVLVSGQHLLSLINEILDLSKVEAGRMDLEPGEFSLRELVDASIAVVRERAARHGIKIEAQVDEELVVGDERKMKQVLFNLLSNAVKFTPDGGTIRVRGWRAEGTWGVTVQDSGVGIPPEDRDRIFEEFQQSRSAGARAHEGTGLGLALSKRFVQLHGGNIEVESEVGAGTTFTVKIPRP